MNTRIHVLNEDHHRLGYFIDKFWTLNKDLILYTQNQTKFNPNKQVFTDIKSFGQIRKHQYIYDSEGNIMGIARQEFINRLMNNLAKNVNPLLSGVSPRRSYEVLFPNFTVAGEVIKNAFIVTDTEFLFYSFDSPRIQDPTSRQVQRQHLVARATKQSVDKIKSIICQNAKWTVEVFETNNENPIMNPEVIATIIAIKSREDIQAASNIKWQLILDVLKFVTKNIEKNKQDQDQEESLPFYI